MKKCWRLTNAYDTRRFQRVKLNIDLSLKKECVIYIFLSHKVIALWEVMKGGFNMNQEELKKRARRFTEELQVPISRFANKVGFDRSSYYRWLKGENVFSEAKLNKIDNYLKKYGF